ncbi:MAG: hypothetical protein JXB13_05210 [Phycisphaerae bacterium]|nr:hypothetical protein [Phycisphaerae bacterium]
MSTRRRKAITLLCVIVAGAAPACAPTSTTPAPTVDEIHAAPADTRVTLFPHVVLDSAAGTIEVDAHFCLRRGILEYAAVAEGGKTYESLLVLPCRPSHLQTALLLAGCEPGSVGPDARGDEPPTTAPAKRGTIIRLEIALGLPAEAVPIERFLIDRRTGRSPDPLRWVFTGSFFHRDQPDSPEYFIADVERSVIALWYDATALLNITRDVGNPYRGPVGLEVNTLMLPPPETPVRLRIIPVPAGPG